MVHAHAAAAECLLALRRAAYLTTQSRCLYRRRPSQRTKSALSCACRGVPRGHCTRARVLPPSHAPPPLRRASQQQRVPASSHASASAKCGGYEHDAVTIIGINMHMRMPHAICTGTRTYQHHQHQHMQKPLAHACRRQCACGTVALRHSGSKREVGLLTCSQGPIGPVERGRQQRA